MPGGGVVNGQARVLWPWKEGEDPGEGGWRVEVRRDPSVVDATWKRREEERFAGAVLPQPLRLLSFGPHGVQGLPTADPLGDLPPLPPPPKGGRKPPPEPPPPEDPDEEEEPVPMNPEIAKGKSLIESIRDDERVLPLFRRRAHRALAAFDKGGVW